MYRHPGGRLVAGRSACRLYLRARCSSRALWFLGLADAATTAAQRADVQFMFVTMAGEPHADPNAAPAATSDRIGGVLFRGCWETAPPPD